MYDIIKNKMTGKTLTKQEIDFFINGYVKCDIPDYQVSALLMAIMFKDLSKDETSDLTFAMLNSGKVNTFNASGVYVDKHSTGGVSDSTSLIIVPLVCTFGLKFAKMSGFGLGHTGGTLDKLLSFPNYDINIPLTRFDEILNTVGCSIIGQTNEIVPADKLLYALRDVTATVDNIGLIASSIMSKKLASGSDTIVLDVKCGNGAFMQDLDDAIKLAETMVYIGKKAGKNISAIVSDMNQPLGDNVGCNLEVVEAISILNGSIDNNLKELSLILASHILINGGVFSHFDSAHSACQNAINDRSALGKLYDMVKAHGGDESYVMDISKFKTASKKVDIIAEEDGYINYIDCKGIGTCVGQLGGGRLTKTDSIDKEVGIKFYKKLGCFVKKGDKLAEMYYNRDNDKNINKMLESCFKINSNAVIERNLVYEIIK